MSSAVLCGPLPAVRYQAGFRDRSEHESTRLRRLAALWRVGDRLFMVTRIPQFYEGRQSDLRIILSSEPIVWLAPSK